MGDVRPLDLRLLIKVEKVLFLDQFCWQNCWHSHFQHFSIFSLNIEHFTNLVHLSFSDSLHFLIELELELGAVLSNNKILYICVHVCLHHCCGTDPYTVYYLFLGFIRPIALHDVQHHLLIPFDFQHQASLGHGVFSFSFSFSFFSCH